MSNMGCLMGAISWFLNLSRKYSQISSDPERKAKTSYFGVYAIIISVVIGGLFVASVWGITAIIGAIDDSGLGVILLCVLATICAVVALTLFAEYIFGGVMGVVYQFRCNRRPIAWISLAVLILTAAAMVFGLVYVISLVDA